MTFVADVSFDSASMTGAILTSLGCSGVIGYAGCADTAKNVSKATFEDWLAHGLQVSLVIENGATDMANPANGAPMGHAILTAAQALGYDVANCVLWASADFDVPPGSKTLAAVDECMAAFSGVVPNGGLYANSYAIDYSWHSGSAVKWWQSDSKSFSNGTSVHAHLQQQFNDPRAKGQPIDVNDILRTPLGFMSLTSKEPDVSLVIIRNSNGAEALIGLSQPVPISSTTTVTGLESAGVQVAQIDPVDFAKIMATGNVAPDNAGIELLLQQVLSGIEAITPTDNSGIEGLLRALTAAVQAIPAGAAPAPASETPVPYTLTGTLTPQGATS